MFLTLLNGISFDSSSSETCYKINVSRFESYQSGIITREGRTDVFVTQNAVQGGGWGDCSVYAIRIQSLTNDPPDFAIIKRRIMITI